MGDHKGRMKELTSLLRCPLCHGQIVDATTITECLHTFCKSCIVKFLEDNTSCPTCGSLIHQSYPLDYISHDRTIQDIVNKVFPDLKQRESDRELQFYRDHPKIKNPKRLDTKPYSAPPPKPAASQNINDYHRSDEQLSVQLECKSHTLKPLKHRYLRCSSQSTVLLLKKFVAAQLFNDVSRCNELDIVCNDELLGKDHMLKYVVLTRWRFRDPPLVLHYRQKLELT
ncbi:hypothetical protein RvY_01502 [Ramazzottius varieornatus]|uniref:RING-type domain-containing protein n=1 Tax=Ramazzottius varieornatus TaxID=947166 RepID=A0A1D1UGJ7_RAMVA|nr:hypothetical protein RvY_01502 [Ramazzottius varieornatus]